MSKEKKSKETVSKEKAVEEPNNQEVQALEAQDLQVQDLKAQAQEAKVQDEPSVPEPKIKEPRSHEIKLQDTKKPANLRANAVPADGYVLSIDGKLKKSYDSANEAVAAGVKLKQAYPVIQVAVYDAAKRSYAPVDLPEQEK